MSKYSDIMSATGAMKGILSANNGGKLEYGAITEQGDLGLGFNVLNESDQEIMKRNKEKEDKEKNKYLYPQQVSCWGIYF